MKRYIYIIGAIIIIVAIALVVYFLMNRSSAPLPDNGQQGSLPTVPTQGNNGGGSGTGTNGTGDNGTGGTGNNGTNGTGGLSTAAAVTATFNDQVFEYFVADQNNFFAVEPDGKIAQVTSNQPTYLNSTVISNLLSAGFSYDGKKVFVSFGDPANPQTSIFDITTKAWTPLPQGLLSPAWSPVDYRLAYLRANATGTEALSTLDLSKANTKPVQLFTLNANDLRLSWPGKNQLALFDKASTYAQGSAWTYDLSKKTFAPVISERNGLEVGWDTATTSVNLAFSGGAGYKGGQLQLIDAAGNGLQTLSFITLPSKCSFAFLPAPSSTATSTPAVTATSSASSTTSKKAAPMQAATSTPQGPLALFCGVPRNQNILAFTELPDAYEQMGLFTSDDVYAINALTGTALPLFFDKTKNYDVTDLKAVGGAIYFINRYDQKLYNIPPAP